MAFSSDLSRAKDVRKASCLFFDVLAIEAECCSKIDRRCDIEQTKGQEDRTENGLGSTRAGHGELSGTRGPVPRPMPKSVESSGQ